MGGYSALPQRLAGEAYRPDWATPAPLFAELDAEFGFTLDAAASSANAKCARYFTAEDDALTLDWGRQVVWLNPPYGRGLERWVAKARDAAEREGATVVCLLPARTDTRWWHEHAAHAEVRFLRGRLRFEGAPNSAPFASALVIFRPAA